MTKKLGFGLMRLPLSDVANEIIDIEQTKKMADYFMSKGFTYFDTAAPYIKGNSEGAFRQAVVERYPRESYTITDKLSLFMIKEEKEILGFFEKQLKELGVTYLDYYLLHALGADSFRKAEEMHAFEFACKLKAEGKVKHIGFSFHDNAKVLDEILTKHPEMEYVQLQINYLDWEDENVQSRACYEVAMKHNKQVLIMEPVKGGSLVNIPKEAEKLFKAYHPELSIASWAIRFAASLPNVMMVLSGMSNEEQMMDNLSYMENFIPLNEEEKKVIDTATAIIKSEIAIPCTACRYCIEDCPKKIPIPECFAVYNDLKKEAGKAETSEADYQKVTNGLGKASDCIKCGKCEKHCPQHLPIREYLVEVAGELE